MKDWTALRERYMRDDLPVRLGGLAANLSRIKSFSENENNRDAVANLIDESKTFIEWTAAQAEINTAEWMVNIIRHNLSGKPSIVTDKQRSSLSPRRSVFQRLRGLGDCQPDVSLRST